MKKLITLFIISLALGAGISYAQTGTAGIYKSAGDFLNGKLTHQGKHTRIKLHEVFKKELLVVKYNDSTYTYFKKDLFGYVDKDGLTYRFFNNEIYPILNPTEKILIYKQTYGLGIKNSPIVTKYFFSKEAGTEILPLTLKNLERVYSADTLFDGFLEIHVKNDNELAEYDYIHKMYKLNRLFELSKTGKIN